MITFRVTILFFISVFCYSSIAQVSTGDYYDLNGYYISGYFDPIQYSSKEVVKINAFNLKEYYEYGYYFDLDGKKIEGRLQVGRKSFRFKENGSRVSRKVDAKDVQGVKVGVDSFFVANEIEVQRTNGILSKRRNDFVLFITATDDFIFAKHFDSPGDLLDINFNDIGDYDSLDIDQTYLVRRKESSNWTSFPKDKSFKDVALLFFGHVPHLKQKILNESVNSKKMMSLIKELEYFEKFQAGGKLYFDRYWNESDVSNFYYSGVIREFKGGNYIIDYFKGGKRLYSICYDSFYPNSKNGLFQAFSKNRLIKSIEYIQNKEKSVSVYHQNGKIHYQYEKLVRTNARDTGFQPIKDKKWIYNKYSFVGDSSGNQTSNLESFVESYYDPIRKLTMYNSFQDSIIVSSYYSRKGTKIYRTCDPKFKFKTKEMNKKMFFLTEQKTHMNAALENAQGEVLVNLIISSKGRLIEAQVLNSLHSEVDSRVRQYLTKLESNIKFKTYKVDDVKVAYEVVVPIKFIINKYYHSPRPTDLYFYPYNDVFWDNPHLKINEQLFQDPINPNPPMPRIY